MLGTIKKLWKRIFPPLGVSHGSAPFPDIDKDSLRRELEVVEKAKEEGVKNLPDSHSVRAASYEQTIVQGISKIASDTSQKLTAVLKSHAQTAQLTPVQFDRIALKNAVVSYKTDVEGILVGATPEINASMRRLAQRETELSRFRKTHGLRRHAEYPDSSLLTWAVLAAIMVLESLLNGYFFAQGSASGMLGGFGQAAMISLVNVLLAAAVALLPARLIPHKNIILKLVGVLVTAAYFVVLVVVLLFLTQYRDAFTADPDKALQVAFQNIEAGNWKPSDINSYLFFALTLLFAIGAFVKVLYSDDRYLGYGRMTRKVVAAEELIAGYQDDLSSAIQREKDLCREKIEEFGEKIEFNVNSIHDAVKSHNRLLSHWENFGQHLVACHDALVADYRIANRNARSDTPPDWFKEITPFDMAAYQPQVQECSLPDGLPEHLEEYKDFEARAIEVLSKTHNNMIEEMHALLSLDNYGKVS
ncbi:hypothetical protein [Granulosicoccus antarcticus]|uniref:Uncharacterized protein n=1 Tax=Granulosicoccus antarcticus IMCC3135 TaxID=1192854 RepID=A0A2Z2NN31_9GAMM|nr:hypothetical protein [Granulosicoccus antarcticus]ASJ72796.1 hypothetical protein IMCC3135_13555 [Granulosicoccus antarcticus IMCC3135]